MVILAADNPDSTATGTRTVEGLVRDIACPLQNKKSLQPATAGVHHDVREVRLSDGDSDGGWHGVRSGHGIYAGHRQDALKPFIGEHVQATGKVFERNGGHAIEITEIHKLRPRRVSR